MSEVKNLTEQAKRYGSLTVTLNVDDVTALLKRAEAAEEKIETALRAVDNLDAERNVLRAKLAELEKQEPIFQIEVSGNHWLNAGPVDDPDFTGLPDGINQLYARPAPAINLAELVPDAIDPDYELIKRILPTANPDEYACCVGADMWNACRSAMLRNIEEQSK